MKVSDNEQQALDDLFDSTNGGFHCGTVFFSREYDHFVEIQAQYCTLRGTIPESIGQLSELEVLDLNYNKLSGSLPSSLGKLLKLKTLNVNYNSFTGSLPDSFINLKNLYELDVSYNLLMKGTLPSFLEQLTNLHSLAIRGNSFYGSIPNFLSQISILDLKENQMTGIIPSTLCNYYHDNNKFLCYPECLTKTY